MALNAKLYQTDRSAERHSVNLDGTLRDSSMAAFDTTIEDLSATGFRTLPITALDIGETISLGLSGLGLRKARVVRAEARGYGCEFLMPLGVDELKVALSGVSSEPIPFPASAFATGLSADMPEPFVEPFSKRTRLAVAASLVVASWGGVIGVMKLL